MAYVASDWNDTNMTTKAMHRRTPVEDARRVSYRSPRQSDAVSIHALVKASPPLDANSTYAYLLVCTHFADTSLVADTEDGIAGFVSAYLEPANPTVLFVWQVAVSSRVRGQGVGLGMLRWLLDREACCHVCYLETTITQSNEASMRMFRRLAGSLHVPHNVRPRFSCEDLGGSHEEEHLVRIGPLSPRVGGGA